MNKLTCYRLTPPAGGGFHFGQQGLELEESRVTFPSDSLFAALVATKAEQEGDAAAEAFLRPFLPNSDSDPNRFNPPFRLTSLFPYVGNLPLLPLPQLPIQTKQKQGNGDEPAVPRKFTKKVRFVSPKIFQQLCAAQEMDDYLDEKENGRFLQEGKVWLTADEQAKLPANWQTRSPEQLRQQHIWHQGNVTRVTIGRKQEQSMVYLMGRVLFNDGCGLWLGVQTEPDSGAWQKKLHLLLTHLGDRGIGGERANGYGQYSLSQTEAFDLPEMAAGNGYHLLLSRYYPQKTEIPALQAELSAYALVSVGGWLTPSRVDAATTDNKRRKPLRMVEASSVLYGIVTGQTEDVRPNGFPHGVYRCGLALTVPVTATTIKETSMV
jgi:CRISPR-associated protein Csm4